LLNYVCKHCPSTIDLTQTVDFFDYYFSTLSYLASRKERRAKFDADTSSRSPPLTEDAYTKELKSYLGRERVILRKRRTKTKVHQFHIIAQIGQGGYGEVFLARKRDSGEVCALKKMRKGTLIKMDEARHVLIERDILTATKSPWLVGLLYAFQDPEFVYLAMEYVPGGDFRTLLNNSGVLKEVHARFYIAEMFAAVNELHRLGYIHRDLKPEVRVAVIIQCTRTQLHHLELLGGRSRTCQAHRLWTRHWSVGSQTHRVTAYQTRPRKKQRGCPQKYSRAAELVCFHAGGKSAICAWAALFMPTYRNPTNSVFALTAGRFGRWLTGLHGPRSSAREAIHVHRRLLVFGLHPLRVPYWIPTLFWQHA
jgi:hypothetical protein